MGGDDNRRMTLHPDLAPPSAPTFPGGLCRLDDWGLIRASGPDALTFLNGQLTQELKDLPEGEARLAGYCSAKGRLMASFLVWRAGPEELLLACSAELLPTTLKRLSMFVLRARCKLTDARAELALWGWAGALPGPGTVVSAPWPGAAGQVTVNDDDLSCIRLPDVLGWQRALLVAPATADAPVAGPALAADDWRWLEVASGVVRIVAPTVEQFVPQMVNLELVGGVSFKKGCYPGQEVVARSQYRGTLKRRGALLRSPVPLAAGQEVFQAQDPGQPAGLVALAARSTADEAHLALVELKLAALAAGDLHLGSADGPLLTPVALPYEVPQDAD